MKAEVWDEVARDNYPLSVLVIILELAVATGRKRSPGEKIHLNYEIRCCLGESRRIFSTGWFCHDSPTSQNVKSRARANPVGFYQHTMLYKEREILPHPALITSPQSLPSRLRPSPHLLSNHRTSSELGSKF